MAHKIFVSYKFADSSVQKLTPVYDDWTLTLPAIGEHQTTVRDYVDYFERRVKRNGSAIYKGEHNGEDLSHLTDEGIWARLKDKIYDSSVTAVFISPQMREIWHSERDQWIPWEVAYSLRESTRSDRTSHSNALLCVILPDRYGLYSYYHTMSQFTIIRNNIANDYAEVVQWNSFIGNTEYYIQRAIVKKDWVPSYKIDKTVI